MADKGRNRKETRSGKVLMQPLAFQCIYSPKTRPGFKPINISVLRSVHLAPECFTRSLDLAESKHHNISGSRHLERGSIPTIDVLVEQEKSETTDRERRMVGKLIIFFLHSTITHVNFSDRRRNLILFNVFYADYEKAYKFCALLLSRCCFSGYCSVT